MTLICVNLHKVWSRFWKEDNLFKIDFQKESQKLPSPHFSLGSWRAVSDVCEMVLFINWTVVKINLLCNRAAGIRWVPVPSGFMLHSK